MTYRPLTVERWGGLDLRSEVGEVGPGTAQDLLNVDIFGDGTKLGSRNGLSSTITGTGTYVRISASLSGKMILLRQSGAALFLDHVAMTGGSTSNVGSWGAGSTAWTGDTLFGTPTSTLHFVASTEALRKYDGATVALSTGKPKYVAVYPRENRLAQAYYAAAADPPGGANGSPHTIFFSDAGVPETYSANNYVHLRPGDDENIRGIFAWRDYLFVFKTTCMFVFYGTSTDSTGNPVFNYRGPIQLPSPLATEATSVTGVQWPMVAVGEEGVYLRLRNGIYRTDGQSFTEISKQIRTLFATTESSGTDGNYYGLSYADNRLYVQSTTNQLVYSPKLDAWLIWQFKGGTGTPTNMIAGQFNFGWQVQTMVAIGSTGYEVRADATADAGTNITSRYRTGFFAPGGNTAESTIRELILDGTGTVGVKGSTNWGSLGSATNLTLGTSPTAAQGRYRKVQRGRQHSYEFSSVSGGAWTLNQATYHLRDVRPVGMKS